MPSIGELRRPGFRGKTAVHFSQSGISS
jgi:hypothetical protein